MRRLALPVAAAFDDDLVAGVGQPVQGAIAQDGVVEETQPFVHGTIAGDDEAGHTVPVEYELVEIGGLLGGEPVQSQVVEDEQIGCQKGPESALQRIVHSGLSHCPEVVVGVSEADGVAGTDGGVAQGLARKLLPTPAGPTSRTCSRLVRNFRQKAA